jgi:hypothetical protein
MPGAKSARTAMVIVAIIVIGGLLAAMMAAPGAVAPR